MPKRQPFWGPGWPRLAGMVAAMLVVFAWRLAYPPEYGPASIENLAIGESLTRGDVIITKNGEGDSSLKPGEYRIEKISD